MYSVVRQAKEFGAYLIIFSGGEPLVRKTDMRILCERHPDYASPVFTNGTHFDEAFTAEMPGVKCFAPAISVEGFEEATGSRRGKVTD